MPRDARAYLWDARRAADHIATFVQGRSRDDYLADAMLRAAVERQFEIIGEALNNLARAAPDLAGRIPETAGAVALRNILIHGYARVDNGIVWRTVHENLPALRERVKALLAELGDAP